MFEMTVSFLDLTVLFFALTTKPWAGDVRIEALSLQSHSNAIVAFPRPQNHFNNLQSVLYSLLVISFSRGIYPA